MGVLLVDQVKFRYILLGGVMLVIAANPLSS